MVAPKKTAGASRKYEPPVNIPLDFETAVDGLLHVDPAKVPKPTPKKPTAKNRRKKKPGKT